MKYSYEIEYRQQDFPPTYIIKEYSELYLNGWFFVHEFAIKKIGNESFNRTKSWLQNNHPELLL